MVLVDTASNPILRLEQAGLEFNDLTDIILTHFHPDQVSGLPLLLMDLWLMGRRQSLNIYGLHHTIDRVEQLMGLYNWAEWPDFFPVVFFRLPAAELTAVLNCPDFTIKASPVHHLIPTIGLRIVSDPLCNRKIFRRRPGKDSRRILSREGLACKRFHDAGFQQKKSPLPARKRGE